MTPFMVTIQSWVEMTGRTGAFRISSYPGTTVPLGDSVSLDYTGKKLDYLPIVKSPPSVVPESPRDNKKVMILGSFGYASKALSKKEFPLYWVPFSVAAIEERLGL
jgi:hypothetical protein